MVAQLKRRSWHASPTSIPFTPLSFSQPSQPVTKHSKKGSISGARFKWRDFVVPSEFVDPLKELFKAPKTKGGRHRDFVNDVFMVKQRVASNDILPISRKIAVAKNASRKCLFCNQKFLNRSLKFNEHVASHLICYRCPNEDCTSKDENGRNKLFARPGSYERHIKQRCCSGQGKPIALRLPAAKLLAERAKAQLLEVGEDSK